MPRTARGGRPRPVIGVLVGFPVYEDFAANSFAMPIFAGMRRAARSRGVDLLVACGMGTGAGPLQEIRPAWHEPGGDVDFVPVGPWNTDGLLVLHPLRSEARLHGLGELARAGFPILSLGATESGPRIVVDNAGGILSCLRHLAGHGHRAIAFIAGDETDKGDSLARLNAFHAAQEELDLSRDPRLVAYGRHWQRGGHDAMVTVLDAGVRFTAVMCSNDHCAIGAIQALREKGLRVPADVAVAGFDDQPPAATLSPPLTTAHYPLGETGMRSVHLLCDALEGTAPLPSLVQIETRLVLRQSCGCLDLGSQESAGDPGQKRTDALAQALHVSSASATPGAFLGALTELLQADEVQEKDVHAWQDTLSALSRRAGASAGSAADALLHQARVLVSESVRRQGARNVLARDRQGARLGRLASRLLSSLQEDEVLAALAEELPSLGVGGCHVCYFDPPGTEDRFSWSTCRTAGTGTERLRFPTREFPPPGLYPPGETRCIDILPLRAQDERLGYVALEAQAHDDLAMVAGQLAAALKTARLHAEVQSLSLTDSLTGVANRRQFDITLQKEIDRSQRYGRAVSTIIADVDLFKNYNDRYGHPAGDEALREIARCFVRATRQGLDLVCRYGGEEFAVILPETSASGACLVAERIREEVHQSRAFREPLSVSLGLASVIGKGAGRDLLLDTADKALYAAKTSGRNRVAVGSCPE